MTKILFATVLILFFASLLVLFSAPTAALLVVAILIGEWGHLCALLAFVVAVMAWRRGRLGKMTALFAIIAGLLCLWPIAQATRIAKSLPKRCDQAFGETHEPGRPFRLAVLFRGHVSAASNIAVTTHKYASDLKLDLYQSKDATSPQPLIVMIHGGSWNRGSKEQLPAINYYLAGQHYVVAAINYRHSPKWQFPAQVDDVFRALDFLKPHADEFHIDATRIIFIGRSAGAQMALSAAYSAREPALRGVVAFYPPTDLTYGYEHPSARWVLDSKRVLEEYLGGTPVQRPNEYFAASPINFVTEKTPPTLLIHGGLDSVVWAVHSGMLEKRLQQARVPYLYLSLGWATHGCDANLSGPSGQLSRYAIDRFLRAAFR